MSYYDCPFCILGIPVTATKKEVEKAWKAKMLFTHPDKCSGEEALERSKILNDAKDRSLESIARREEMENRVNSFFENIEKMAEERIRKEAEERKQQQEQEEKIKKARRAFDLTNEKFKEEMKLKKLRQENASEDDIMTMQVRINQLNMEIERLVPGYIKSSFHAQAAQTQGTKPMRKHVRILSTASHDLLKTRINNFIDENVRMKPRFFVSSADIARAFNAQYNDLANFNSRLFFILFRQGMITKHKNFSWNPSRTGVRGYRGLVLVSK
jgi:curved DNA-binding protein CbpA